MTNPATPIPTIGRIVLFVGGDGQDRPAIVTHVWSPFCVSLQVFPKDSADTNAGLHTSVTHAGPETNEKATPRTWHWMPYQIQTAGQRHQDVPKDDAAADLTAIRKLLLSVACVPPSEHGEVDGVKMLIDRLNVDRGPFAIEVSATSFGAALTALKYGKRVARSGWNGKGMWLALQRPDEHSKMTLPYVYIEYPTGHPAYPNGSRVPWLASQTDMLANDWSVLPD